jgi:hypothetical protein
VRSLLIVLAVAAAGCGRTALEPYQPGTDAAAKDAPRDLPPESKDALQEMAMEHPPDLRPDAPVCVPKKEECNGVDDNCNGKIDEEQPPIPCPDGNYRFCVGGHFSDCPRRCDVCVPGSKRTCITSFCTFWGSQSCAEDGRSFGQCRESQPPPECREVANRMMRSPDLERCCIDNGFCCVDEFDLNNNGDRAEMLGRCESITCDP